MSNMAIVVAVLLDFRDSDFNLLIVTRFLEEKRYISLFRNEGKGGANKGLGLEISLLEYIL